MNTTRTGDICQANSWQAQRSAKHDLDHLLILLREGNTHHRLFFSTKTSVLSNWGSSMCSCQKVRPMASHHRALLSSTHKLPTSMPGYLDPSPLAADLLTKTALNGFGPVLTGVVVPKGRRHPSRQSKCQHKKSQNKMAQAAGKDSVCHTQFCRALKAHGFVPFAAFRNLHFRRHICHGSCNGAIRRNDLDSLKKYIPPSWQEQ